MYRLAPLPPSVRSYLGDFVRRWRRIVALRAIGTSLAVLAVWALLACTADRLLHLPGPVRLISLVLATLLAIAWGLRRLSPIRGPVDWVSMAVIVEQHDPRFGQALITVTSRVLGSPEHRGSDEILSHLLREVEQRAAEPTPTRILTLRSAAAPWIVLLVAVTLVTGLSQIRQLGGPRLLARLAAPMADYAPVTTTELRVTPEGADIMQSDQFHVEVQARHLDNSPVVLLISDDDANWTHYPMDDAGNGRFTYTISAVGRDITYKVRGGDAESRPFTVRVKRSPAVAEFRIHYTYPAYTGKPPATLTNSDGTIEGPPGTEAVVAIVATEPLQSALLTIGDQKLLMEKTAADNIREAKVRIQNDASYELDLISIRDVRGGGPAKMMIRATADRPPLVRLLEAGRVLRINPRDILPLSYQAMDDYGIIAVNAVAQVNGDAPVQIRVHLSGNHRRVEDTAKVDLGSLALKVGDVVTLTINARDTAGKQSASDELRVLVSPLSIDADARERIEGLTASYIFAASLVEETEAADKAIAQAAAQNNPQSPAYASADASASRHLTSASEAATSLRQSLLRVAAHSNSPDLSTALSIWIDAAQRQAQTDDDLFGRAGSPGGMGNPAQDRLHHAAIDAKDLYTQIRTTAQGERARALLADRENLKAIKAATAPADPKAADRFALAVQRLGEEIAANLTAVGAGGLSPDAVEPQLLKDVEAARTLVRSKQPIDFVAALREWAQDLQRDPHHPTGLPARLATAAQVEAVRRDGDFSRARELEQAGRAAGALEMAVDQATPGKSAGALGIGSVAPALAALQRERALLRPSPPARSPDDVKAIHAAANRARDDMARWSGENNTPKTTVTTVRVGELESAAFRVNAATVRREYKRVSEDDRQLMQRLLDAARKPGGRTIEHDVAAAASQVVEDRLQRIQQTSEAVGRQMSIAESLEKLGQAQDRMLVDPRTAKSFPRDWIARQRALADQIAALAPQRPDTTLPTTAPAETQEQINSRSLAMAAALSAQDDLTLLLQVLPAAQDAEAARRKAADRMKAARHDLAEAPPQKLRAANRAADQAVLDFHDAAEQFDKTLAALNAPPPVELADRLEPFAPETSAARDLIAGPLNAALTAFTSAADDEDAGAPARAADDIRAIVSAVSKDLSAAQKTFTERDPVMAASGLARAAADAMARQPADAHLAALHQSQASAALSRAWEKTMHRAADLRLSELPSLQAVYGPPPPAMRDSTLAASTASPLTAHDWPRGSRESEELAGPMRDPDPPGYEESLRLYFELMGKPQDKK